MTEPTQEEEQRFPVHMQTFDLVGLSSPQLSDPLEDRLLKATYGVLQILCSGLPNLNTSGRAEALVATLLRDATLAMGASVLLLEKGLYEPALRELRGLLESRLYIQRIRSGDGEKLANLLAADQLESRKRGLERQITLGIRSPEDDWVRAKLKEMKDLLNGDLAKPLAELKQLRQAGKLWHGYRGIEQLAEALGDANSYHLVYGPTSQMFVHPGDPDVHLVYTDTSVQLRDLVCTEPEKLKSAKHLLTSEGYEVLKAASAPWQLKEELSFVITHLLTLMLIAAAPEHTSAEERQNLEDTSGIPQDHWDHLVHVTFDWQGPDNADPEKH